MSARLLPIVVLLLCTLPAAAFESRVVDASGRPLAGAQVSVVDQTGAVRTDAEGRFVLPRARLPFTLLIVGSRGELYPPFSVERPVAEIRLEAAYRETVTVSTGAAPNIEGTPAAAPIVFGAEEIEQRKPAHVAEAIATAPGVSIRGEGPPAVPVVRGLAGGRTLLLIDDARIVTERRAGPSATFVDPLSLGSIEISRGPGSVAYGSDAIGGVVHLRPRDPVAGQPEVRYDVWGAFGGASVRSASLEVSTDAFGGAVLAAVHGRAADDSHDARGDVIENSQYRDRGLMLRYVRDDEWGRTRIGAMSSVARDVGAPSSDPVLTVYPDERATLITVALDLARLPRVSAASVRASVGSYSVTTDRVRSSGVESAAVKARDASFRLSAERSDAASRLLGGVDLVTRFDLRASGSIEDADRLDAGAFASWSGPLTDRFHLAGGLRVDHIRSSNEGGHFGTISRKDTALSGFAAATTAPWRGLTATLQAARGYREPTFSDRYFRGVSGRGLVTGNPSLEPETSLQFDGSLRWSDARSRVALFLYDYRIDDLVERHRDGADFFFRNRGRARVRGLELEAGTRLPRDFDLQIGAAVARGETGQGDSLDDISAPSLHAALRWAAERSSAFLQATAYGRDDRPGPVEVERPGFVEIDLGAGWRLHPAFEIRIVVRNATNSDRFGSTDEAAARAPGRSVMIGINR